MFLRKLALGLMLFTLMLGVTMVAFAQDQVTIVFSTWDTGSGAANHAAAVVAFMQENPGIQVNNQIRVGEGNARHTQVLVQMASGTAADVIQTGEFWVRPFALAEGGGFLDLTPYIEGENGIDPDALFLPEVYNTGVVDGTPYLLTKDYATTALYINTDMFDEAGIDYPAEGWTYDNLIEIGQELTLDANGNNAASPDFDADNIVQYGIWWRNNWPRAWEDMAYSFGAELLSPDGTVASGYLNSAETVAAMEYWKDMVHTYHFAVPTNAVSAQPGVDFLSTQQAAIHGPRGPWHFGSYSENPDLNWSVSPLPTGPAGHKGVICWSGFGINRNTEHPDEAWQLLKFLGTAPGQRIYAGHAMSSMPTIMEETGVATDPLFEPFIAEADYLHPLDDMKGAKWTECVEGGLADIMLLLHSDEGADVDPQAELDALAESADACLAG